MPALEQLLPGTYLPSTEGAVYSRIGCTSLVGPRIPDSVAWYQIRSLALVKSSWNWALTEAAQDLAQGCSALAQDKAARAHVQVRKWDLVRLSLAPEYCGSFSVVLGYIRV